MNTILWICIGIIISIILFIAGITIISIMIFGNDNVDQNIPDCPYKVEDSLY